MSPRGNIGGVHNMFVIRSCLVAITIVLIPTIWSYGLAQPKPPLDRPKIGLVLAGGGAKGAAHVGVIKVLEELGGADRLHNRHQHGRNCRRSLLVRPLGGRTGSRGQID